MLWQRYQRHQKATPSKLQQIAGCCSLELPPEMVLLGISSYRSESWPVFIAQSRVAFQKSHQTQKASLPELVQEKCCRTSLDIDGKSMQIIVNPCQPCTFESIPSKEKEFPPRLWRQTTHVGGRKTSPWSGDANAWGTAWANLQESPGEKFECLAPAQPERQDLMQHHQTQNQSVRRSMYETITLVGVNVDLWWEPILMQGTEKDKKKENRPSDILNFWVTWWNMWGHPCGSSTSRDLLQARRITIKRPSSRKLFLQNKLAHQDGQDCLLRGMKKAQWMRLRIRNRTNDLGFQWSSRQAVLKILKEPLLLS